MLLKDNKGKRTPSPSKPRGLWIIIILIYIAILKPKKAKKKKIWAESNATSERIGEIWESQRNLVVGPIIPFFVLGLLPRQKK